MEENREQISEDIYGKVAKWVVIAGTAIFIFIFFGYFIYNVWSNGWIVQILQNHYAATVSLPMAAIASAWIVFLFRFSTGPIEFSALGLTFKGASGPIVFWVLCFLAFIIGLKVLW